MIRGFVGGCVVLVNLIHFCLFFEFRREEGRREEKRWWWWVEEVGRDERGEARAAPGEPVGSARGRHAAAQGTPLQRPRRGRRPGPLLAVCPHCVLQQMNGGIL